MARKPTTTRNLETDVDKELEQALDVSFNDEDIDLTSSMEELEAQISLAADELAREGRGATTRHKQPGTPARAEPRPAAARPAK
ncbi:hypothetical protein EJC49_02785, partial [Aquibium carbonis]